jgi:hypothetical protein
LEDDLLVFRTGAGQDLPFGIQDLALTSESQFTPGPDFMSGTVGGYGVHGIFQAAGTHGLLAIGQEPDLRDGTTNRPLAGPESWPLPERPSQNRS